MSNGNTNGFAIAALVIGIISLLFNPLFIGSILAIVFGVIGRKRATQRGMATAGIVLGVVSAVILIVFIFAMGGAMMGGPMMR